MSALPLLILLAGAASPAQNNGPRPAQLLEGSIRNEDYPAPALRARAEGRVTMRYRIDRQGRVANCKVTESSGHESLDSASCTLVMQRFRFEPARDRSGRPVEEMKTQRVIWRLPDPDPTPFEASRVVHSIQAMDGRVSHCTTAVTGLENQREEGEVCGARLPVRMLNWLARQPGEFSVTQIRSILPDGAPAPAVDLSAYGRLAWTAQASIVLNPDGAVSDCWVTERRQLDPSPDLPPPPDPCTVFGGVDRPAFAAARPGSGQRSGRLEISLFVRRDPSIPPPEPPPPNPTQGPPLSVQPPPPFRGPAAPPPPPPPPPRPWAGGQGERGPILRSGSISDDDYPAAAIRREEEGTVTARLTVGSDGRVTGCTIVATSGSAVLDSTSCQLMVRRFRYDPARDRRGRAVVGYVTQRIRWQLPDDFVPAPFVPGYVAVSVPFDAGGEAGCDQAASRPELLPIAPDLCAEAFPPSERRAGGAAAGPALAVLTISDSGPTPPPRPEVRGTLRYREEASFEVHATGAATACRRNVTRSTGREPAFDLCRYLATEDGPFFAPDYVVPSPRQGRMILEIYDLPAPIDPDDL